MSGLPLPSFLSDSAETLLQSLPLSVLALAPDGTVALLNAEAEALWGVPSLAVLGREPAQVLPAVLPADLLYALRQPPAPVAEYLLPHTSQWIALRMALAPAGHTWVYWDNATARRQLAEEHARLREAQLRRAASEALLHASEEVARTGSYEGELATMRFHFSDGLFHLFGEEPQSFVPTLEFINSRSLPADARKVQLVLDQAVLERSSYYYTRHIYRADGQLRLLESHGRVVCDAAGNPVKLLGQVQDITDRKEAEAELRKQYQILQQAEDVARMGSWEYDLGTDSLRWSGGMYQLFNLPHGSPVCPETYLEYVLEEDRPIGQRLVAALRTGQEFLDETLRIRVQQQVLTLKVKGVTQQEPPGQPYRVLGVDLDITELRRLEADNLHLRLEQQRARFDAVLEAQEIERTRIAEGLHNGVGQLLYATKLQLTQLRLAPSATTWDRADSLLAEAIRQTRTLSHELIPMVLAEGGLPTALHDIYRQLSTRQFRFGCHVALDPPPLPPPLQVALFRIAQELAQNVVKHAHATEASLALETVPGFVLLRAEDNGIGFPARALDGAGIGLRAIRDRVSLLGGTLNVGSSPELGTYVRLRIPLSAPLPG